MSLLSRIWAYLPILWKDRDSDYAYMLILLAFKLRRMQKYQQTFGRRNKVGVNTDTLQLAAEALERLAADDYCSQEFNTYYKKFLQPGLMESIADTLQRTPNPEQAKIIMDLVNEEQRLKQVDVDLFCDTFRAAYSRWWV